MAVAHAAGQHADRDARTVKTIAFIGLGSMGVPMAKNLLACGFTVRGYDLRPAQAQAIAAAGGRGTRCVADACSDADAAILMVVNAAQAEAILFQDGGLDALPQNAIVVLMATCPPRAVESIAARVLASGRRFVDAPVSGGVAGAIAGTLTIMAAGERNTLDAVFPVLHALGRKVLRVGDRAGCGAMMKTINQLLCGVNLAAAAEALSFAQKLGLDRAIVLDILSESSAASWMLRDRGPRMLEEEPRVTSAVDIFVKDLGIVLETGRDAKAAIPLAALAHQLFLATSGRGDGDVDDSQVIRSYGALNGG